MEDYASSYFNDIHYNSFETKMNWQFVRKWNLMTKGIYEIMNVFSVE